MPPLVAVAFVDAAADVSAVVAILAMAAFGFRYGLFLAVVSALTVLTASVAALALAPGVASHLELLGFTAPLVLPVAYVAILAAIMAVVRVAIGGAVGEDDVRLRPLVDRIGGTAVGAFAGMLLGGALLVGWSMCELPAGARLNAPAMTMDLGARCAWTCARLLVPDKDGREMLFGGDPVHLGGTAKMIRASEPFDDADGDWMKDESERYLDYDRNGEFTYDEPVTDLPRGKPDVRDIGLSQRYWLSAWRMARVLHRPQITSPPTSPAPGATEPGALVYQARGSDPDDQDKVVYRLKPGADDDSALLVIDTETGDVRFGEAPIDPALKAVTFVVVCTDRSALTDEQKVVVTLNPSPVAVPGP